MMMSPRVVECVHKAAPDRYLKQADLAECGRQKQVMKRISALETTVAQRVGVSMVYSTTQLQLQPAYLHFLEQLADGAATRGSVGWGSEPPPPAHCLHADWLCRLLAWLNLVEQAP